MITPATTHCNTLQHTATHCNTLLPTATNCIALQHIATHCNTLQRTATHCNTLQHTASHCITLHHNASHCNTLQHTALHTASHCNTLQHTHRLLRSQYPPSWSPCHCLFIYTATHCNTLQRTATHCNIMQRNATHTQAAALTIPAFLIAMPLDQIAPVHAFLHIRVWRAVTIQVKECVAVCCSVLPCVAVWSRFMQMSFVPQMNKSHHTDEWVTSHICIMSLTWMSHDSDSAASDAVRACAILRGPRVLHRCC